MILWAMIFALGVLVASLTWLLALPIVSRRAVRLATARLAQRMPLSMAEIDAERDQLRAVHAVGVRRLEQAGEAASERLAAAMSENGRHLARIAALEQAGAALQADLRRLTAELATATQALYDAQGTLGTQTTVLHETLALSERRHDFLTATEARLADEQMLADERRGTIAGLETRATGQDLRLREARAQVARLADELATARTALSAATGDLQIERADRLRLATARDGSQGNGGVLTTETAVLRAELEKSTRIANRAQRRSELQAETINGLADRILAQDAEIDALQRRLDGEPAPTGNPPTPDDRGPAREARLRAAVAVLGAELVDFATRDDADPEGEGLSGTA